jgi:two-component system alkaline phosphatase synthesis response regulator PhoP
MKSKKVLIVDDNDLNRRLFENLIGEFYDFKSAENGIEALKKLEIEQFDLILMDIQMPQMDGITALKKIKQGKLSDSPVVAITAFADEGDRDSFLKMGFDEFMTKPIRPKKFFEVINRALENKSETATIGNDLPFHEVILDRKVVAQLMKFNSRDNIKKVYEDFLTECDEIWEAIENALTENHPEVIMDKLHIIKGNSGTLGANIIYLISQKAESAARLMDQDKLLEYLPILKKEIELFQQFIKEETIFEP